MIGLAFLMVPMASGCASNVAGARPSDMSQQQHESVATEERTKAASHSRQYDPAALTAVDDCTQYLGSCWGSNPTDQHKEQAEAHGRAAAAHAAAAGALGAAEARACEGVSPADRDTSPFFHHDGIVETRPLTRYVGSDERRVEEPAGATVIMLPAAGLTAERLERVVQCHIARNAALGTLTEMPYCPLALKGVSANVTSAGNGFAVNIAAQDKGTAAEVLRRARAL